MSNSIVTEKDLRLFLMDKPELNTLISGVRWTPEMIELALQLTVDRFNLIQPPTGTSYTLENFGNKYLLLTGAAAFLLKSASIGDAANSFTYNADAVQVDDRDKAQIFLSLSKELEAEFKEQATNMKISQNISVVYGGHPSEYANRYH